MGQNAIPSAVANKVGGGSVLIQAGKQLDAWMSNRHAKYYNAAYSPTAFFATAAGVTTTVGLATTYTGLCISNPSTSTVNLVIQRVSGIFAVNSTAITGIGLIRGYASGGVTAHTTPGTVQPCNTGVTGTTGVALADTACTLVGTPIWAGWLTSLITTTVVGSTFVFDNDGDQIIQPGGYLAIGTTAASGSSGLYATISWDEIAL
jgi:hypothetical protein